MYRVTLHGRGCAPSAPEPGRLQPLLCGPARWFTGVAAQRIGTPRRRVSRRVDLTPTSLPGAVFQRHHRIWGSAALRGKCRCGADCPHRGRTGFPRTSRPRLFLARGEADLVVSDLEFDISKPEGFQACDEGVGRERDEGVVVMGIADEVKIASVGCEEPTAGMSTRTISRRTRSCSITEGTW